MMNNRSTSKVELSKNLNMSMPTVLSNVNELMESGVLVETGEYASTGGRKAKSIGINPSYRYAAGIMITANHVGMVLVNMRSEVEKTERVRMKFSPETSYCLELSSWSKIFWEIWKLLRSCLESESQFPGSSVGSSILL